MGIFEFKQALKAHVFKTYGTKILDKIPKVKKNKLRFKRKTIEFNYTAMVEKVPRNQLNFDDFEDFDSIDLEDYLDYSFEMEYGSQNIIETRPDLDTMKIAVQGNIHCGDP